MDVSKPFLDTIWIGTSKESVPLEYEGNHAYCEYCGLLGHTLLESAIRNNRITGKQLKRRISALVIR